MLMMNLVFRTREQSPRTLRVKDCAPDCGQVYAVEPGEQLEVAFRDCDVTQFTFGEGTGVSECSRQLGEVTVSAEDGAKITARTDSGDVTISCTEADGKIGINVTVAKPAVAEVAAAATA